jgi:hypothetical protein
VLTFWPVGDFTVVGCFGRALPPVVEREGRGFRNDDDGVEGLVGRFFRNDVGLEWRVLPVVAGRGEGFEGLLGREG